MEDKITVLLVGRSCAVRRGSGGCWKTTKTLSVVGEASDGAEGVKLAAQLRPDVIVMDCQMPVMNGLEATRKNSEREYGSGDFDG